MFLRRDARPNPFRQALQYLTAEASGTTPSWPSAMTPEQVLAAVIRPEVASDYNIAQAAAAVLLEMASPTVFLDASRQAKYDQEPANAKGRGDVVTRFVLRSEATMGRAIGIIEAVGLLDRSIDIDALIAQAREPAAGTVRGGVRGAARRALEAGARTWEAQQTTTVRVQKAVERALDRRRTEASARRR